MEIRARVTNREDEHSASVSTGGAERGIPIPPKAEGLGSSVNGGELLFLALATCYCNDVYREAAGRGLRVDEVDVEVSGRFGDVGEPAGGVTYQVRVRSPEPEEAIVDLLHHTDSVAEIQNSLRAPIEIELTSIDVEPT